MKSVSKLCVVRSIGKLSIALAAIALTPTAWASSHREAPSIAMNPSVDATDLYMFRSYETGARPP
jgi:hypothetical protein